MSVVEVVGLVLAAAAGGAINAVAGGGTLVTFPTLLFFGTPSIQANATSTLALVIGTSGSIYGYRSHLEPVRHWLWRFLPVSLLGGLLGSILLTVTSLETCERAGSVLAGVSMRCTNTLAMLPANATTPRLITATERIIPKGASVVDLVMTSSSCDKDRPASNHARRASMITGNLMRRMVRQRRHVSQHVLSDTYFW